MYSKHAGEILALHAHGDSCCTVPQMTSVLKHWLIKRINKYFIENSDKPEFDYQSPGPCCHLDGRRVQTVKRVRLWLSLSPVGTEWSAGKDRTQLARSRRPQLRYHDSSQGQGSLAMGLFLPRCLAQ